MMNATIFNKMVNFYNSNAYTHNYIFGFTLKGTVYAVKATSDVLAQILTLDKASRGAGYSLRFKPNTGIKLMLMSMGAEPICSTEYFAEVKASDKYNNGEVFEKMMTELAGQTWEKDNVPFTEDGDLTVDGIAYQIKFEKASFITEKQMVGMMARG